MPESNHHEAHPLRIAVVGGVAGGASAATRARRVNEHAEITLFEKDGHVSFANCGLPYYVGGEIADREKLLVARAQLLRDRFRLDVRTGQEVTAIDRARRELTVLDHATGKRYTHPYDKVILAPGASPIVPPLEGVNADNVLTLRNVADVDRIKARVDELTGQERPGRAVVIGAGYIGLEMAEQLVERGMGVSVVELQNQVLPLLDEDMAYLVERELRERGVALRLGVSAASFRLDDPAASQARPGRAQAVVLSDESVIEADVFILGIGVRPNTKLAADAGLELGATGGITVDEVMRTSDPDIYAAGDAVEYHYAPLNRRMRVALAGPANRAGRIAGEHAATGRASVSMAAVQGTSVVRVFSRTAAMTGLSVKAAGREGIEPGVALIQANHHAGYYPGAEPMVLKLLFDPDSGRVLGAQAVGGDGVDKRIDIVATALQFNATVKDLAGLDLAYAPPFGAAKDPIHMAAFVACNQMDGRVRFVEPDATLQNTQVVDLRNPDEIEKTGTIPGALVIPLDELRARLGELERDRPTVCTCASGLRSYNGCRILQQHGFGDVANLSGGMNMWLRWSERRRHREGEVTVGGAGV